MSHINDLLGLVKGLRQVIDAGIKLQQESTRLVWQNSSLRNPLQNCSVNSIATYKSNPDTINDAIERTKVVVHGIKQYVTMCNINSNTNTAEALTSMDPKLQEDIDMLNRQFNETFESLKQAQKKIVSNVTNLPAEELVEPLEQIPVEVVVNENPVNDEVDNRLVKVIEPKSLKPNVNCYAGPSVNSVISTSVKSAPKPVARKKVKVSVSTFF